MTPSQSEIVIRYWTIRPIFRSRFVLAIVTPFAVLIGFMVGFAIGLWRGLTEGIRLCTKDVAMAWAAVRAFEQLPAEVRAEARLRELINRCYAMIIDRKARGG